MRRGAPAADPDAYVEALACWLRDCVEMLRAAIRRAAGFDEIIKWGHLIYLEQGPALLIRAEDTR